MRSGGARPSDEIEVMSPDELNEFVLPHTSEIPRTTVALFRHASGDADLLGSGVLLQVEGTRFLVTAARVSDEFFCERWRQIFFGTPDGDELIPVITVRYARSKIRTDPNREDDPLDLAVLELRPDIADQLSAFMRFVTLSDLALDPVKLKDGRYLVVGYPGFRVEKYEMDQTIVAQVLPYFTGLHDLERNPALDISPADHLVFDVNRMDEAESAGDRLDLDETGGISGGGVWRILDEDHPIEALDWRWAKLAAIVTDRSIPEEMGPVQYLRGTKIKRAINLIDEGWEDLRPAIESAIPVRFVG
jgi:hypothetical protein